MSNMLFDNIYTDLAFRSAVFFYTTGIPVLMLVRF